MLFIVLLIFAASASQLEATRITCEALIEVYHRKFKACLLTETTNIRTNDVTFEGLENSDVKGIIFNQNKNIQFLPVKVYKKFPNLSYFWAEQACIKEISTANFQGLLILEFLNLDENQIEFIPNFCFESLISLKKILLSKEPL